MGYYINPPENWPMGARGKREYLRQIGAQNIALVEAQQKVDTHGIIVWVDNGFFEAAAFAYDRKELDAFMHSRDTRPKELFVLPRNRAVELAK